MPAADEGSRPILLKQPFVVNEGAVTPADVLFKDGRISRIASNITPPKQYHQEIQAEGQYLLPGVIDNHVHFREPGLTHKGTIQTESRAAVAGGVTATMEMPNTKPQTIDHEALNDKYQRAAATSWTNHAFYLGATLDNLEAIKQANDSNICGVKVFMGSSTGNMLVDDPEVLGQILRESRHLIAVHAENEQRIQARTKSFGDQYPKGLPIEMHPVIRDAQACYDASKLILDMAREKGARLHILHLTSGEEVPLFDAETPVHQKKITTEACVHHLWFSCDDYGRWGNKLKCYPAIKHAQHQEALLAGLKSGHIDQIASDHAPHTLLEKQRGYSEAPGGIPMVQHNLPAMLAFCNQNYLTLPEVVEKMAHNPAKTYKVQERGFLREGYKADSVLVDLDRSLRVGASHLFSKAQWSPFQDTVFPSSITHTFVNGQLAFHNGVMIDQPQTEPLRFGEQV